MKSKIKKYFMLGFIIPFVFAVALCYLINNIIPVLIIGGMIIVSGIIFFSKIDIPYDNYNNKVGAFLYTLFASGMILLFCTLIYYIISVLMIGIFKLVK